MDSIPFRLLLPLPLGAKILDKGVMWMCICGVCSPLAPVSCLATAIDYISDSCGYKVALLWLCDVLRLRCYVGTVSLAFFSNI
ncbi:hypothetical protein TNCV_152871 [Trichonephila clavipes]|nr:hypothetical protein TNCV_152871 [Trichonephila clavipes]